MKTVLPLLSILFYAAPIIGFCQGRETPAQKIRRLENLASVAVMKGDTATLFKLWSEDYVVNNPNNMILNAGQIKAFTQSGGMDSSSFTRSIERLVFIKDIAVVMGSEVVSPKNKSDNGGKTVTRRFTNIWIKVDTSWQLAARQATNVLIK